MSDLLTLLLGIQIAIIWVEMRKLCMLKVNSNMIVNDATDKVSSASLFAQKFVNWCPL
jgi:hypothetical protein